jgi:hypothetical protein
LKRKVSQEKYLEKFPFRLSLLSNSVLVPDSNRPLFIKETNNIMNNPNAILNHLTTIPIAVAVVTIYAPALIGGTQL